jgi:Na+-driven multidrug efflux pump
MWAAIWTLSWPILAESYLSSLVGLVDTVLAAQISEAATDAIGGASYIMWFIGLIVQAIGIGATALISRSVGGGKRAVAHATTAQTVLLAAIAGVLVGVLLALAAGPTAAVLSLRGDARDAFTTYLSIIAIGTPAIAVLSCGIACARGAGDAVRPLMSMVVVNIVNIIAAVTLSGVDLTTTRLVDGQPVSRVWFANPFGFDLGVAGIAWGTVIAHYVGALVVLRMLVSGRTGVRLKRRWLRPHAVTIARVLRLGFTGFLEMLGMWLGNFLVLLMVGWLAISGTTHAHEHGGMLGAHIVAIRIEAFSFLPGFAMGVAAATLVGQYLGAGSPALARSAIIRCTTIASAIMGVAGLCFCLFPKTIVGMISSQPTHLELAPKLLFITGLVQIPFAISNVLRSALRGAGDVKAVMWIIWISTYAVRLPLAYALSGVDVPIPAALGGGVIDNPFFTEPSLPMLWVALTTEIVVRAAMCTHRFLSGRWQSARV